MLLKTRQFEENLQIAHLQNTVWNRRH